MRNIVLFDLPEVHCACLPITFTRAVSDVRVGILTIKEKWQHYVPGDYTALTAGYLAVMYPAVPDEALFIAGNVCPDSGLAAAIGSLVSGEALVGADDGVLAFLGTRSDFEARHFLKSTLYREEYVRINASYDIFRENGREMEKDFRVLPAARLN